MLLAMSRDSNERESGANSTFACYLTLIGDRPRLAPRRLTALGQMDIP